MYIYIFTAVICLHHVHSSIYPLKECALYIHVVTLRASCGTVYCNRSCLFVGGLVTVFVGLLLQ